MITTKKTVKKINFIEILFRPQQIHYECIRIFESKYGNEIDLEFKKAYHLINNNLYKFRKVETENKYKALVLLSDGLTTLTLIFHSSLLGYGFENTALLRYYIENLGMSYGIFLDKELYRRWKENPNNEYANKFTKQGLNILNRKYSDLGKLWGKFSQISHIVYTSTGSSFISDKELTIGGAHTKDRDKIINSNIQGAGLLLKLTVKIFNEDFGLL